MGAIVFKTLYNQDDTINFLKIEKKYSSMKYKCLKLLILFEFLSYDWNLIKKILLTFIS